MPVRRVRVGGPGSFAEHERLRAERDLVAFDHRRDRGMVMAWAFEARRNAGARLVEVTRGIPGGSSAPLLPFHFESRAGVCFPHTVILVHPDYWKLIEAGKRSLPRGWDLATARCIWRRRRS